MLRRILTISAATLLTTSLALWAASLWRIIYMHPTGKVPTLILWGGEASIGNNHPYAAPGWTVYGFDHRGVRWRPHPDNGFIRIDGPFAGGAVYWIATIPLWIPAAFGLIGLTPTIGRAARRRRRGVCPRCTYSRAGLPATAPCPECGPSKK